MTKKSTLAKYVHEYLEFELRLITIGPVGLAESDLSMEERTLIYKYSEDGYESANRSLRKSLGQTHTQFGKFLETTLRKLPDYKGLVFRSANLSHTELDRYIQAFNKSTILVEHSFISASASYDIAAMFGGNCKFEMISKTGKAIELYAKYGLESGQNEYEVLFRPNRKFGVLEITKMSGHTLIIMEEM
jgi:hypothetical protein